MCEVYVDEPVECYRETTHRARKPHRCDACSSVVTTGESYVRVFFVWEGEPYTERVCSACHEAHRTFVEAHSAAPYSPGSLGDTLRECIEAAAEDGEDASRWRSLLAGLLGRRRAARSAA